MESVAVVSCARTMVLRKQSIRADFFTESKRIL
jgi:hypothetical protein